MADIKAIEDALIAEVKAALTIGGALKVRSVVSAPGDWDRDMLKRMLAMVPCVLVVFSGGPVLATGTQTTEIDAHFRVIIATGHASGQEARRRGDSQEIGAYEILQRLLPKLDGLDVGDEGTLKLTELENLFSGEVDKQGLAIYALTLTLPLTFPLIADPALLSDFITFDAMYDIPPFAGEAEYDSWLAGDFSQSKPEAEDEVPLPQS